MAEESFVLLSLDDDKAKDYAEVIRNPTCRKILDLLSKKDYTETDLSKALDLPLSTVHYNMKHLVSTGLVNADEFHYSTRGKEVNHYSLANKLIIIAPKRKDNLKEKLSKFFPLGVVAIVGTAIVYGLASARTFSKATADVGVEQSNRLMAAAPTAQAVPAISSAANSSIMWFVGGAAFVFVLFLIYEFVFQKNKV